MQQRWTEPAYRIESIFHPAGDILLVLFTIMASALISASFALFLVRERECASKTVQMISGAAPTAFWLATAVWDGLSFCVPVLGDSDALAPSHGSFCN